MSLLAVLRKIGETMATYDVPNHSNDLPELRESMKILHQEINMTLTSLIEGEEASEGSGSGNDEEMDDDSDEADGAAVNGNKRKLTNDEFNKKLKTS